MNKVDALLTQIAQRILRIETLESRHRDSLDFHEVSVLELRDALEAAYNAGTKVCSNLGCHENETWR